MKTENLYATPFATIYPWYVKKIEKKGRTVDELHTIIHWLTGYTEKALADNLEKQTSLRDFYEKAKLNPNRKLITGVICGVRVEEIQEPLMQEIRYMDKVIDELAHGKPLEKIMRED